MTQQTLAEIPLRRRDGTIAAHALVDHADEAWVNQQRWHLAPRSGPVYARGSVSTRPYLHRFLLGLENGDPRAVDHIDGNGLNNQRSNLRIATQAENMQNLRERGRTRGASRIVKTGRWRAYYQTGGRYRHLGVYATQEEAARAAATYRRENVPFSSEWRERR